MEGMIPMLHSSAHPAPSPYATSNLWDDSREEPEWQWIADRIVGLEQWRQREVIFRIIDARGLGIEITPDTLETLIAAVDTTEPHRPLTLWQREQGRKPKVYYIRLGDQIKIGTSINPVSRARALSLTPSHIIATEAGDRELERERHEQFAHLRLHGEWFRAAPDLLAHIAGINAA